MKRGRARAVPDGQHDRGDRALGGSGVRRSGHPRERRAAPGEP
ncbi:hypothetical protein SCE1572_07370 [Sorangium cellulosum So0157-2]|uniref:Uncharacterized protein n=1 Tax=Sorangium cellulosum So0157-2 TaxID=1254432 RepID=S4XP94_SORCE|nr:hypothetical protein SCE1572_07370 [Sorangium cellulosum So0157-2]